MANDNLVINFKLMKKNILIDSLFKDKIEDIEFTDKAPDFDAFMQNHANEIPKANIFKKIWHRIKTISIKQTLLTSVILNILFITYILYSNNNNDTIKLKTVRLQKQTQPTHRIHYQTKHNYDTIKNNDYQAILQYLQHIEHKIDQKYQTEPPITENKVIIDTIIKYDTITVKKEIPVPQDANLSKKQEYALYELDTKPEFIDEQGRLVSVSELASYINYNLDYSKIPIKEQKTTRVQFQFKILKDNNIVDFQVKNTGSTMLEKEVAKTIRLIPEWRAGKVKNQMVNTKIIYSVIIKFDTKNPFPRF